ncbi:MAG: carboxypeptidase-like regulatory domain-containing protein, partial [Mucilaginibacter sp.]|nr:carboxypeptidase-like regulatory domain-containing protein [Mucilaginibacter sp.]
MKPLLLALFFSLLSALTIAQSGGPTATITVEGTVLDSATNKPMGYVTVAIQDSKTHAGVKSGLTKDDGSFSLKAPTGSGYEAVFIFVGYRNKIVPLASGGSAINVGKISLAASASQLKEVSVTAARPLMKQEVDRI